MASAKSATWLRIVLGLLGLVILGFTLPAYLNSANNPALANLSGDVAGLGSVAGAFLGRQLVIALIALYGAFHGGAQPMMIGAFGLAFFNLHDAVMIGSFGEGYASAGAIAGVVLGVAALIVMILSRRSA